MKPKRKRAYHRALKRGEPWALLESGIKTIHLNMRLIHFQIPEENNAIVGLKDWLDTDDN